jgi:hypothetical protein
MHQGGCHTVHDLEHLGGKKEEDFGAKSVLQDTCPVIDQGGDVPAKDDSRAVFQLFM